MKKTIKSILIFVAVSLAVGFLAGLISRDSVEQYAEIQKPSFSPPQWLFPVVWTILYILMGVSAGLVYRTSSPYREPGLSLFAIQLGVNFLWPIIFFVEGWYLFAFFWLCLLLVLVCLMTYNFYKAKPAAAYLQAPYIVWLLFAGVLNLAVALMN